ncbi:hypothetical protein WJT86_08335 [Microvirga sp. W0021]|uniref:Uncharacterized protein n=1 Tax=Hohaiivirga grylli TaxID=3133970 RepID=A0ABV0BJ90_9HYPH
MNKIEIFLDRLKAEQRRLIVVSSEADVLPTNNTLTKISELENCIAAVELAIQEGKNNKSEKTK